MIAADLTAQGMPDGELLAVVALVLVPLLATYAWQTLQATRRRADLPAPSTGEAARANRLPCSSQNCDGHGTNTLKGWLFCRDCYDEMFTRVTPYDREAAELVAETEAWLRGGAA